MTLPGLLPRSRLPDRDALARWLAPLPRAVEDFGLRAVWLVVLTNLVGTVFGFWYYGFHPIPLSDPLITGQFAMEPAILWPLIPDSPVATLFIALALGAWALDRSSEYLNALAFFGCWKLGFWTPFVLTVFSENFLATTPLPMYLFLLFSHLAMVVQAFVLHRISEFPVRAVGVALLWYGLNDLVDYFVPLVGTPHHTLIPGQTLGVDGFLTHPTEIHSLAAAGAVTLTVTATFLTLATRIEKLETESA
ncbi:DUF1405 domain-containing protein [Halolamina salifodinae]|uniref:Putative membrane protein YpjA n=1 Tax=Halolamina salifodinae TaxID=1202767 RepID=A0A8T4H117_9EURY|nr:DUF1405 domain-containing protein [Halolamina salifodinae]MBP1987275.1 putative membrane protein YpjA [Halolamina salifodinae]